MKMTEDFVGFLKAIFSAVPEAIAQAFQTYKQSQSVVEEDIADCAKELENLFLPCSFEDVLGFPSCGVHCHSLMSF